MGGAEKWYAGNPQNIVKLNDFIPDGTDLYVTYCGSDKFETFKQKNPEKGNYPYGEDAFYIKGKVIDCRNYPHQDKFLVMLEVGESGNKSLTPGKDFMVDSQRDKVSVIDQQGKGYHERRRRRSKKYRKRRTIKTKKRRTKKTKRYNRRNNK